MSGFHSGFKELSFSSIPSCFSMAVRAVRSSQGRATIHGDSDIPAPCLGCGFPSEGSLLGNFLMEVVLTLVSCLHSLLKVMKIILPIFKSTGLQTSSPGSQAASERPEPELLEQGRD